MEEAHQHLTTVMGAVDQSVQEARADAMKGQDRRISDALTEAHYQGWLAGAEAISKAWDAKLTAAERAALRDEAERDGLPHSLRSLAIEQPARDALNLSTDADRTNDHAGQH
ncbi:hypothetical protein [Citricoccus sp.]|uniref:hypothetical protein n=1 Tax=Citricoccus sp. TaxID=1978372 RepID=UPI0026353819|nr:hypothetical protein [Citricoccus sp.]HRO31282.1 hypothetical protein [Citricoccus sp.]